MMKETHQKLRPSIEKENFVDLGLHVKWASCNLKAASPLERGALYAFGETEEKSKYLFSNYKHGKNGVVYDYDVPPMFQDYASPKKIDIEEFEDIGNISGTDMDVAHVLLGDDVRMPEEHEAEELVRLCKQQLVEGGIRLTGPNGRSIDMPFGIFWTGTLDNDTSDPNNMFITTKRYGRCIHVHEELGVTVSSYYRTAGVMIRPVACK